MRLQSLALVCAFAVLVAGCGNNSTTVPSIGSGSTPAPISATPGNGATATPGAGASATPGAVASATPRPTATPTQSATATPIPSPSASASTAAAKIGHVFVVILENESASTTFSSTSPAVYLNKTVVPSGAYLSNYYGTGHVSLDNYIAMVSGQAPTVMTSSDCQYYLDSPAVTMDSNGQALGATCVYPATVPTIFDQLTTGLTWKTYVEDMGNDPTRDNTTAAGTCGHPALNSQDKTQTAEAPTSTLPNGDQFATRHAPEFYFHSVIDKPICATSVVNAQKNFASDLASISTTANYSFYTPNLCDDGHDSPCVTGATGGLTSIDAFLKTIVPTITNSPAFQKDGLLVITFDEAATTDASSCCGEMGTATDPLPGISGLGGGVIGAVLLSPFIKPGTVSTTSYNHYSQLRSIEDIFGLTHLGYAGQSTVPSFGSDVFTAMSVAGRPFSLRQR
jgi:hypothetical protein